MIKTFLEYVAKDIIDKYGTDLSRIVVVFPNKRASLFLNEQLAQIVDHPLWSPVYTTISELFREYSDLIVADQIKLVCNLYKSFVKYTETDESLDHFYGWGQLLLSDYDDIDKNMADADMIFMNLKNIHELDDISYLTEQQKQLIQKFFHNFNENQETELKRKFISLWNHFGEIYHHFNKSLAKQGLTYEGALYRKVAEKDNLQLKYDKYLFVGFNMLQTAEQRLFKTMMKQGKAFFYWDFDKYYMPHNGFMNEAGHYISQYMHDFPNELDTKSQEIYDNLDKPKSVTFIRTSTDNIQTRYIGNWLEESGRSYDGKKTAIIMCDESLLQSVLYTIPDNVESLNITLGFPLKLTTVSSFVERLIDLQSFGLRGKDRLYLPYVKKILRHPFAKYLSPDSENLLKTLLQDKNYYPSIDSLNSNPVLSLIFQNLQNIKNNKNNINLTLVMWIMDILKNVGIRIKDLDDDLVKESIFRMYTIFNRFSNLMTDGDLNVNSVTLRRLIKQLIDSTTVPFHGEPATGIQIMGVLETRNIDFKHVLILSCNEGNMPKGVNDASFIPYSIRKAYGLTTIDNKVAIYSYYFHRMIQRAEDVTIMYNSSTDGLNTGEMSRFMLQIMAESRHKIKYLNIQSEHTEESIKRKDVDKNDEIMEKMLQINNISPSAINQYIRCNLQFFYNYVLSIKEPDNNEDDSMDNRIFGNIFHRSAFYIFKKYIGRKKTIIKEEIEYIRKNPKEIENAVDKAFCEELFQTYNKFTPQYNGLQMISRMVIIGYLKRMLELDSKLTPFSILGLEQDVGEDINITTMGRDHCVHIKGIIDRLDMLNVSEKKLIRVVDYKTGRPSDPKTGKIKSVEDIFSDKNISQKHADYYLQTFLYSIIIDDSKQWNPDKLNVSPALLFIRQTAKDDYNPILKIDEHPVTDIRTVKKTFLKLLTEKLEEMFNPQIPFRRTTDKTRCLTCPYRKICGM